MFLKGTMHKFGVISLQTNF